MRKRVYLAIKYHADHQNRDLIETISALLDQAGADTRCITRDVEQWGAVELTPASLMRHSFQEIDQCDLVLVEFSEPGVGLGIEAGYAFARGIPVVTVVRRGCPVSTTLQGISSVVVEYAAWADLGAVLADCVQLADWVQLADCVQRHGR